MVKSTKGFCFFLSRKQGTHLIGVVELVMTTAIFTMTLLGAAVVLETYNLRLKPDIQEWKDMAEIPQEGGHIALSPDERIDEIKLKMGERLALGRMMYMSICVAATVIHLISCVLLIFGTVTGARAFLLPWLGTSFMISVFGTTMLCLSVVNSFLGKGSITTILGLLLYLQIRMFLWLVVFGHYREITRMSQWTPVIHHEVEFIKTLPGPAKVQKEKPFDV